MKLLSWNVRGMNSVDKHTVIKGVVRTTKAGFLFLQETKMDIIDVQVICSLSYFWEVYFVFALSIGASRGILLLWNSMLWTTLDVFVGSFSVSALVSKT